MNINELTYLLGAYLIVSDEEIDINELQVLHTLPVSSESINLKQKGILSNNDDKISIIKLINSAKKLSNSDLYTLFENLISIAYADGYYDSREKTFLEDLCFELHFAKETFDYIQKEIRERTRFTFNSQTEITWLDSLKSAFDNLVFELSEDKDEGKEHELLSGTHFVKRVKAAVKRATEDLSLCQHYYSDFNQKLTIEFNAIDKSIKNIKKNEVKKESESLISILEELNNSLKRNVGQALFDNLNMLNKKGRTINYFTIAFMGRTKAGKSTFHKVVTHEEDDDIGVGKVRTTRFNRSWYWENIRIVDTPGIGAPGGKTDTETAKSIIDEADLICYLVTDDSVQTAEFDFLHLLKERNKPIFIILNKKDNLHEEARMRKFLRNPFKWKETEGAKSLEGHFVRIKEELKKSNVNPDSIKIIPLHLKAAQYAFENHPQKEALIEGSNIKEFVREIKQTICQSGNLKKTQNIVDGCSFQANSMRLEFEQMRNKIVTEYQALKKSAIDIKSFVKKERKKTRDKIEQKIELAYKRSINNAKQFSEVHYDKKNVQELWETDRNNKKIIEDLNIGIAQLNDDFSQSLTEKLDESLSDLSFVLSENSIEYAGEKVMNTKLGVTIATTLVSAVTTAVLLAKAAAIATALSTPVGWVIGGIMGLGMLIGFIPRLFASKEEKIAKKKAKLCEKLEEEINKQFKSEKIKTFTQFDKQMESLAQKIFDIFDNLLDETSHILIVLERITKYASNAEDSLNTLFVHRILQHIGIADVEVISETKIEKLKTSIKVDRDYKLSKMQIKSPYEISTDLKQELELLIQTKIEFITI